MTALFPECHYLVYAAAAGLFAGVACAVSGVFVVTMHVSFLGVTIAHAAFAGSLFGVLLGVPCAIPSLAFSICAGAAVGPLADRGQLTPDTAMGIVFSLTLGLGFLFLGMIPGARTEALNLFWGSILTTGPRELASLAGAMAAILLFLAAFYKEIQAVACHREAAFSSGVPATAVYYGMLLMTGIVISICLPAVGGLLIYTLIVNPAAAAFQLTYRFKAMISLSALFGAGSCWAGLATSYFLDLPAGACIVLASTLLFAAAALVSPKRKGFAWTQRLFK